MVYLVGWHVSDRQIYGTRRCSLGWGGRMFGCWGKSEHKACVMYRGIIVPSICNAYDEHRINSALHVRIGGVVDCHMISRHRNRDIYWRYWGSWKYARACTDPRFECVSRVVTNPSDFATCVRDATRECVSADARAGSGALSGISQDDAGRHLNIAVLGSDLVDKRDVRSNPWSPFRRI
jgi:hypothetical protein